MGLIPGWGIRSCMLCGVVKKKKQKKKQENPKQLTIINKTGICFGKCYEAQSK